VTGACGDFDRVVIACYGARAKREETMRGRITIVVALIAAGCGNSGDAKEEAKREAEALEKKAEAPKPAPKMLPPVPGEGHIPCEQLIDPVVFTTALGETEPLAVKDVTKQDAEAAASCSLVKGGVKLTAAEQEALAKKTNRRMGVLPGDDLCNITAYCWTVENEENFKARCKQKGREESTAMGNFSCVQVVAQGADDVHVHQFFDPDTKCILQVRGGPSNVDNDKILACANTARDSIGPDQIKVDVVMPPAP
jgi:hypothetical protein